MQIVAAGRRVQIEHLAGKIQPGDAFGLQRLGIDFLYIHATAGNNRLVKSAQAFRRERHGLQEPDQRFALLSRYAVDRRRRGQMREQQQLQAQIVRNEAVHCGHELLSGQFAEIAHKPCIERRFVQRGL